MVAGVLSLLSSGVSGESDFEDSQESLIADSQKSFLLGLIDINNFAFGDMDDLVKALDLSPHDFCDPESFIHESFSSLYRHKTLAFTKEESESSGDILA